ncbi:MAG: ABC transporter ATP-binding protein [Acidimicrobiia bacterium]
MTLAESPQPPDEVTLRARGVVVRYGSRVAVDGVDLDVGRRQILGLLGPNGAGKTTLLRRLAGLLAGQAGQVRLGDADPVDDPAIRARIGYLPEDPPLYGDDTVLAYVSYLAALSGVGRRHRRAEAEAALDRAGAAKLSGRLAGRLSKGQRQRVALAGVIVHRPDVLLLDEPSDGLDPRQVVSFRALLRELREDAAIVFSTHLLAEAQTVCDRVVVIDGGRVVLDRPVGGGPVRLRVDVHGADRPAVQCALLGVAGVRTFDGAVAVVESPAVAEAIAETIVRSGWRLRGLSPAPDDLETAFLAAVEGRRDAKAPR